MRTRANTIAGGEEAAYGGHLAVSPVITVGRNVLGAADPGAGFTAVAAHDVGLGQDYFGGALFGGDVVGGPQDGLGDGHVQEVFPGFPDNFTPAHRVAGSQRLDGFGGFELDGAVAGLDFGPEQVVAKRGGRREGGTIGIVFFEFGQAVDEVVFAGGVGEVGAEQLRPGANRAVGILETAGHEAVFHLGHLAADGNDETVHRAGVEDGVPGASHAFAHAAGTEQGSGAAGATYHGVGLENVDHILANAEPDGAGDAIGVVGIGEQVGDENAFVVVIRAEGFFGGFRDDGLVGLAVNHYLPATFTDVLFVVVVPEGQPPLLEHVDAAVHVAGDVVHQVFPGNAHHVIADVLDVIFGLVPSPATAHIHVNGRQAFTNSAAPVGGGLVDHDDAQVVAAPVAGFDSGAATGHTAADDQHITFNNTGGRFRHDGVVAPGWEWVGEGTALREVWLGVDLTQAFQGLDEFGHEFLAVSYAVRTGRIAVKSLVERRRNHILAEQMLRGALVTDQLFDYLLKQRVGMVLPAPAFGYGFDGVGSRAPHLVAGFLKFAAGQLVVNEAQEMPAAFPVIIHGGADHVLLRSFRQQQVFGFAEKGLGTQRIAISRLHTGVGIDAAPFGGAGGKAEMLGSAVAKRNVPHDVLPFVMGLNLGAKGHEVSVAAHVHGVFGAQLHAGVALGAHFGLLIGALVYQVVQHHEVVGANVYALRAAVNSGAGVAGGRVNVGWHCRPLQFG